ncbi:MAG: squalene--hopene cyclase [candidate division NC10 bacterium]|nr:squalene--hopene cyclase [candidate division NC10 bacterium]
MAGWLAPARRRPLRAPARPRPAPAGPVALPGVEALERAIADARAALLGQQACDGYWMGLLEADVTITAEYCLLQHLLGRVDRRRERKAVARIRDLQLPEGGWAIYPGARSDISATVKAYFAGKLAGVSPEEPWMRRARQVVLDLGGLPRANVFTKIMLALFGQYPWRQIPCMPPEIVFLPSGAPFSLYQMSYWSRTVLVPLLVLFHHRPVKALPPSLGLEELHRGPRGQGEGTSPAAPPLLSLKRALLVLDRVLHFYDHHHISRWRHAALRRAEAWLLPRVEAAGGLAGIYPAMANAVLALRCLGYPDGHPLVEQGIAAIEALVVEGPDRLEVQPCLSPVWDTVLAIHALHEAGLPADDPALVRAGTWLLGRQVRVPGDWQVKRRGLEPAGWPFQFSNDFYPDNDDTAAALMALKRLRLPDVEGQEAAMRRGLAWLLGMQGEDGGWGSFDADNNRLWLNNIPFADHGALLDPSTEDLTGRALDTMGRFGYGPDFPPARRGLRFLRATQVPGGGWHGRWGVNYIYGTWSVMRGLKAIGERLDAPYVREALDWVEGVQNPDGGWGESCDSYADPSLAGTGPSTPSQTAWALMALVDGGRGRGEAAARGAAYLLRMQGKDGRWTDPGFNGTGFPRVFYLRYHLYPLTFPLWALAAYRDVLRGTR